MRSAARQFVFAEGQWEERRLVSSGAQQSRRARATKGDLFLRVSVVGPDRDLAEEAISREIARVYYEDSSRSVTTSLRHAIESVDERMRADNEAYDSDERQYAAVSGVVLREDDAFVALAGGGLAYFVTEDGITPITPPHFGGGEPIGLGGEVAVEPDFYRHSPESRCAFILGGSSLPDLAPAESVWQLLLDGETGDIGTALMRVATSPPEYVMAVVVDALPVERQPAAEDADDDLAEGDQTEDDLEPGGDRTTAEEAPEADENAAFEEESLASSAVKPRGAFGEDVYGPELKIGDRLVLALRGLVRFVGRMTAPGPRQIQRLIVLAIMALGLFAIVVVPLKLWEDYQQGTAQADLVTRANLKEQEAATTQDQARRLELLREANSYAQRAELIRRGDPTVVALADRMQNLLDTEAGVSRLTAVVDLVTIDGEPTRIALGGGDVYVLNRGSDRVTRYALDPSGKAVVSSGSPVIARLGDKVDQVTIGHPVDLLWMPAGSSRPRDSLVFFDDAGGIFEYTSSDGLAPLRLFEPLPAKAVFGGFAGSLYYVDRGSGELRWISPTSSGYDRQPYNYLDPDVGATFKDTVSLAVSGDVYVLRSSGKIERFGVGRLQPFSGAIPDEPLAEGTRLIATGRYLFAVDPANARLVQFDAEGNFVRQYRFVGREDMVDVAIDDSRGLLYYLGQRGLSMYQVNLAQ